MSKKNTGTTIIGYDLNDKYAQISFLKAGAAEPETASMVLGAEQFNIPVALRKKPDSNLWLYGKEALQEEGAFTHLLSLAIAGTEVVAANEHVAPGQVDKELNIKEQFAPEQIDPVALLALFIKRSLSILTIQVNKNDIAAFMFTTKSITPRIVEIIEEVALSLDLPPERVYLQSYRESIYQYVVHQPKELWNHQVLLFDYSSHMKVFRMEGNKKTTPIVVFIENESFPALRYSQAPSERVKKEWDEQFLAISEDIIKGQMISSIYLVGEGFKDEWMSESLKYLCQGRRVFRGNNLYSKGACYGAMEKFSPSEISETMIFLGEDKLKANVGLRLLRNGLESYYAILDAGANWHECETDFELILDEEPELSLIITSLTGGHISECLIPLDGLPERPPRTTRLNFAIHLESPGTALVTITDLGFGDLFHTTGREWVREIAL
ncbi:MAG: DUF5716 family protein [Lachnospiraceae bacterium]|nr:DUF5716 family protein [Lachnospiraceae bacterium]